MEHSLRLRTEMERSYLIQRLHKPLSMKIAGKEVDNPFSFGGGLKNGGLSDDAMKLLRNVCSFDYMGSAEFEFGAVPMVLRFLAGQSAQRNVAAGTLHFGKSERIFYICPKPYEEQVKKVITNLRTMKPFVQLKEHCGLKEYFESKSDKDWQKRNVGWLELDNGFAFFVDKEMFEKFCKLLGIRTD